MNHPTIDLAVLNALEDECEELLHLAADNNGTVALVFINKKGETVYSAQEFTQDGEADDWSFAGGYTTTNKHHYMGERYKTPALWGEYFYDVFYDAEHSDMTNRDPEPIGDPTSHIPVTWQKSVWEPVVWPFSPTCDFTCYRFRTGTKPRAEGVTDGYIYLQVHEDVSPRPLHNQPGKTATPSKYTYCNCQGDESDDSFYGELRPEQNNLSLEEAQAAVIDEVLNFVRRF